MRRLSRREWELVLPMIALRIVRLGTLTRRVTALVLIVLSLLGSTTFTWVTKES